MLRRFKADLHVHTCLSPCGDLQMTPQKIVGEVLRQGIELVAICDHNSARNVPAVLRAAQGRNVVVIPGMEVCTSEESHVLALFDDVESVMELQAVVYANLQGENNADVFGAQVVVDEFDEVCGTEGKLLIGATDLSVDDIVGAIHRLGGIAIASHIDRESYSVVGQLGFIPPRVRFDALELSSHITDVQAATRFQQYEHYAFVRNSDAHFLSDIGTNLSVYILDEPTLPEIAKALRRLDGRDVGPLSVLPRSEPADAAGART
jgi:predicted metal-dependent phosphoesterase TrpH